MVTPSYHLMSTSVIVLVNFSPKVDAQNNTNYSASHDYCTCVCKSGKSSRYCQYWRMNFENNHIMPRSWYFLNISFLKKRSAYVAEKQSKGIIILSYNRAKSVVARKWNLTKPWNTNMAMSDITLLECWVRQKCNLILDEV